MNAPAVDSGYFDSLINEYPPAVQPPKLQIKASANTSADQLAIEAGQQIIGNWLLNGRPDGAENIQSDDFLEWQHRKIHAALTALENRGEPSGIIEVASEIGQQDLDRLGGISFLTSLTSALLKKSTLPGCIKILKDSARARKLRSHALSIMGDINAGLPVEMVEQRAREEFDNSIKEEPGQSINSFSSCGDFLAVQHENIVPLIGAEDDALLVRGEGVLFAGEAGVGKTMYITSVAANLSTGENILRWRLKKPLRVLICQAELPAPFFQRRVKMLVDSYRLTKTLRFIEEQGVFDHKDDPEVDGFLKSRQVRYGLYDAMECAAEALVISHEKIVEILDEGVKRTLPAVPQNDTAGL